MESKPSAECEITLVELQEMKINIPFAVQIRSKLNKCGFKFEDDGTLGAVINKNPVPLGKVICRKDYNTGSLHYKQWL